MYSVDIEYLVRALCFQDEMTSDVKYSEEEIQKYLASEDPLTTRMIDASIKLWKLGEKNDTFNEQT